MGDLILKTNKVDNFFVALIPFSYHKLQPVRANHFNVQFYSWSIYLYILSISFLEVMCWMTTCFNGCIKEKKTKNNKKKIVG